MRLAIFHWTEVVEFWAVSSSIVRADALSIRNHAASLAFQLSHGII